MKCLMRYGWVKLMRSHLPEGKGILGMGAKLASRAAFRKGHATYCGYKNEVIAGMWSGGIVGVKSILGVRSRRKALETLDALSELGYIRYTLDVKRQKSLHIRLPIGLSDALVRNVRMEQFIRQTDTDFYVCRAV